MILVAVAEGQVVGYIHASNDQTLYLPPLKNLLGFAVAGAFRNNGIGTALLSAVEEWRKKPVPAAFG